MSWLSLHRVETCIADARKAHIAQVYPHRADHPLAPVDLADQRRNAGARELWLQHPVTQLQLRIRPSGDSLARESADVPSAPASAWDSEESTAVYCRLVDRPRSWGGRGLHPADRAEGLLCGRAARGMVAEGPVA
eukprot:2545758-Rhodomonas_salina.3